MYFLGYMKAVLIMSLKIILTFNFHRPARKKWSVNVDPASKIVFLIKTLLFLFKIEIFRFNNYFFESIMFSSLRELN